MTKATQRKNQPKWFEHMDSLQAQHEALACKAHCKLDETNLMRQVLSMVSLLWHEDPASWTTADGHHHSTSDLVTGTESLVSLAFLVAVVAVAYFVADSGSAGSALGEDRLGDALYAGVDGEE